MLSQAQTRSPVINPACLLSYTITRWPADGSSRPSMAMTEGHLPRWVGSPVPWFKGTPAVLKSAESCAQLLMPHTLVGCRRWRLLAFKGCRRRSGIHSAEDCVGGEGLRKQIRPQTIMCISYSFFFYFCKPPYWFASEELLHCKKPQDEHIVLLLLWVHPENFRNFDFHCVLQKYTLRLFRSLDSFQNIILPQFRFLTFDLFVNILLEKTSRKTWNLSSVISPK